ncbi:hypothetical protein [Brachybacterium sp. FME24]|uniref:hypothetical protein n=1 Tax=Brachybacterium sp. FME24 TaxID=2742605 RepID=UPI001866C516|nr:hypothetical protein [Brachybacterium sp. FME24]
MGTLSVQALRAIIWLSRVVQVVIVDIDVMLARRAMPVGVLTDPAAPRATTPESRPVTNRMIEGTVIPWQPVSRRWRSTAAR